MSGMSLVMSEIPPNAIQTPGSPVEIERWGLMWLAPTKRPLRTDFIDALLGLRATFLGYADITLEDGPRTISNLAHIKLVDRPKRRLQHWDACSRGNTGPPAVDTDLFDELYCEPRMLRWFTLIDAIGKLE